MQQLLALVLLAVALIRTWLTWPLRRGRSLRQFEQHYGGEGLVPKGPELHRALSGAGKCTGCRRCDAAPLLSGQASGGPALSYLVQAGLRSLPDADLAHRGFSSYPTETLRIASELCPYGVCLIESAALAEAAANSLSAETPAVQVTSRS